MAMMYKLEEDGKTATPIDDDDLTSLREQRGDNFILKQGMVLQSLVSTVFLAINHGTDEVPLLWETMIFDRSVNNDNHEHNYVERYSTYEEAEEGHQRAVDFVERSVTDQ